VLFAAAIVFLLACLPSQVSSEITMNKFFPAYQGGIWRCCFTDCYGRAMPCTDTSIYFTPNNVTPYYNNCVRLHNANLEVCQRTKLDQFKANFAVRPVCQVQIIAGRGATGEVFTKIVRCPSGASYGRVGLPCTCPAAPNHRGVLVRQ
jgi:hypothetical protein